MSFKKGHIDQVISLRGTGCQSCGKLAVIDGIRYSVISICRFCPSVTAHIVNENDTRVNSIAFFEDIVSDETACIKNSYLFLGYPGLFDQAFKK